MIGYQSLFVDRSFCSIFYLDFCHLAKEDGQLQRIIGKIWMHSILVVVTPRIVILWM